jgi:hypothetical protein
MVNKALVPIEQKQVVFYDDEITAVRLENGRIFIPVRPICEALGLDWSAQYRRINSDMVLSDVSMSVVVTATDINVSSRRPRTSEMLCLPLDYLNGWLFGVNAKRVKDAIRDRLVRYQRECYKVLGEAFHDGRLSTDTDFESLLNQADSDVAQAYRMALAIVQLARQQVIMDGRLQVAEIQLTSHAQRLDQIEATLTDDGRIITEVQASHLSQAVKAVAMAMSKPNFQQVYGQMYRHYEITSYKLLPAAKFDDAMKFLTAWFVRLTGSSDVPF